MECFDVQANLVPYIEKDLTAGLAEEITGHVNNCAFCRKELVKETQLSALLARPRPELVHISPESLNQRLRNIQQAIEAPARRIAEPTVTTLEIGRISEQHRQALQVIALAGAVFASLQMRGRLPRSRAVVGQDSTKTGPSGSLEVDPIVLDHFILLLDLKAMDADRFYLRMTLHNVEDPEQTIENCHITWKRNNEFRDSATTDEDGLAEFLSIEPGEHEFTFSRDASPMLTLHVVVS
jgi:hypothetical protein